MGRAPCCDKANVKKGPWSPEEDRKLKDYIEKHGTGSNWIALPHKAGLKRCGKSCRLRWLNYLRPNIKHGDFSDDEDRIILNLFSSIGSRWSIIASQLPGRTDNDIKNYWNTKLKKKLMGFPQSQRKLSQQQQQIKPQLFPSPLQTTTDTFSSPLGLEGILIPPYVMNSNTSILSSTPLIQGKDDQSGTSTILTFGGEQSCSSSDLGRDMDYELCNNVCEQIGFESYLFGGGMEDTQKLILGDGGGGGGEISFENYNYEQETKHMVGSNSNVGLLIDGPSSACLKSQGRFLYF
ncbi:uncharacterized protein [Typha latifolia]|uniref:uncharacterized protein n=1 Tax=Typha latifolia TaxID=4733 RepID=UPI003C2B053E